MVTVVGTLSGKEFLVEDQTYIFQDPFTGESIRWFIGADRKGILKVPDQNIEFVQEPFTEEKLAGMIKAVNMKVRKEHDPNSG